MPDIFKRNRFGICIRTVVNIVIRVEVFKLYRLSTYKVFRNITDTRIQACSLLEFIYLFFAVVYIIGDILRKLVSIIAFNCIGIKDVKFTVAVYVNIQIVIFNAGYQIPDIIRILVCTCIL